MKKIVKAIGYTLLAIIGAFLVLVVSSQAVKAEAMIVTGKVIGNPVIVNSPEEECLALNVYYEARSDNMAGKYAVADTVLNRVADSRYPNTVCGVIKQGRLGDNSGEIRKHQCQFSWYCDGKSDNPTEEESWQRAQIVAYNIVNYRKFRGITEGATHYHATYVSPMWIDSLELIGTIGQHIFYRWD